MRLRPALIATVALVALAGCEQGVPDEAEPAAEETAADPVSAAMPGAEPSGMSAETEEGAREPGVPTGMVGNTRAAVSSLTANISDLNVRVTDMSTIIELPADVLFAFDKAELTPEATNALTKAADLIRQGAPGEIEIVGHTDSKGSDDYNDDLSRRRAQAVADWFGQQVGVRQRSFEVIGRGEIEPVVPNETADGADDPEGRAKNRRVEVVIPRG